MLGVDRSYALLTPEMARAHVANGQRCLDQCLFDGRTQPPNRGVNLRNALDAGMVIRAYFSPNQDVAGSFRQAIGGVASDLLQALLDLAVDYEEANRGVDYEAALQLVNGWGQGRLLYTNNDTWMLDGNKPWPADTRCWNADWNTDVSKLMPHPYGGLTEGDPRVIGRQYAGGADEDLDIWTDIPPPPQDDYFVRFESQAFLKSGKIWNLTGTFDKPPGVA
jgi:hypothetical protein